MKVEFQPTASLMGCLLRVIGFTLIALNAAWWVTVLAILLSTSWKVERTSEDGTA